MALPQIGKLIFDIRLPVSKTLIKIRPYTVGEEKDILTVSSSNDKRLMLNTLINVAKGCIVSDEKQPFNFDTLNIIDFSYLIIALRAKSKKEIVPVSLEKICDECSKVEKKDTVKLFKGKLDLLKDFKIENDKVSETVVDLRSNLKVTIELPNYKMLYTTIDFEEQKELTTDESKKNEIDFENGISGLYHIIKKITYDGKDYKQADFSLQEFSQWLAENFMESDIDAMQESFKKLPEFRYEYTIKDDAGHTELMTTSNIFDFFF